jgi:hypothetical protein
VNYPTGPDVVPLLKKLKFNSKFGPAFAQVWVFGCFNVFLFTITFDSFISESWA